MLYNLHLLFVQVSYLVHIVHLLFHFHFYLLMRLHLKLVVFFFVLLELFCLFHLLKLRLIWISLMLSQSLLYILFQSRRHLHFLVYILYPFHCLCMMATLHLLAYIYHSPYYLLLNLYLLVQFHHYMCILIFLLYL